MDYRIFEIDKNNKSWDSFIKMSAAIDVMNPKWLTIQESYFISDCILVVEIQDQIAGFLRLVTQQIGREEKKFPVIFGSKEILTEGKVRAFGVMPEYRNRGIGKALQEEAMKQAKAKGCYQLRSRSEYEAQENYSLKISMGFGVHPSLTSDSVYFVKAF